MKPFIKISFFVLAFLFCMGLISYWSNLSESQLHLADNSKKSAVTLRYHFVIIAQDINETFWQSLKSGAQEAGEKYKAAVEFDGPVIQDEDDELKYMNIAIASNVDGIAVYVTNKSKFTPLINKAAEKGINVVTIESDDKGSKRNAYIGPDSYNVGASEGSLVTESENGASNVAMILGGNYAGDNDASGALVSGFLSRISAHPEIKLKIFQNSNAEYFGAEKIIRNILYNSPQINTVVCTNSNDTLEVVQVLIDLNKTGSMTVIGYSNSQQIRDYIKSNDIFGSVYENPKQTGYQSVASLVNMQTGAPVDPLINTGVYTISRNNLVNYPDGS